MGVKASEESFRICGAWQQETPMRGAGQRFRGPRNKVAQVTADMQQAPFCLGKRWRARTRRPWPTRFGWGLIGPTITPWKEEIAEKNVIPKILSAEETGARASPNPMPVSDRWGCR